MAGRRPFVLLSAAMSVDGYLDDASPERLVQVSHRLDMEQVRLSRSGFDAILVGANTVRKDNPALGATGDRQPAKVVLTSSGDLDPGARFFTEGAVEKIVLCDAMTPQTARERWRPVATVVPVTSLAEGLAQLKDRGIERLLVEGGSMVHTRFLTGDLVDELRLAVAPFFVGDSKAPRFVGPGEFPHSAKHRMSLLRTEQLGDTAVLHYRLGHHNG